MNKPTSRQKQIYNTMSAYIRKHGYPPTIREIGDAVGISSPNGITCHLKALEKKGWIRTTPGQSRAITLLVGEWPWSKEQS